MFRTLTQGCWVKVRMFQVMWMDLTFLAKTYLTIHPTPPPRMLRPITASPRPGAPCLRSTTLGTTTGGPAAWAAILPSPRPTIACTPLLLQPVSRPPLIPCHPQPVYFPPPLPSTSSRLLLLPSLLPRQPTCP